MKRCLLGLAALANLGFGACGGGGTPVPVVDPARFVADVSHSYFPISPGWLWLYEGEEEGAPMREEVRSLHERRDILGVPCTALEQRTFVDGALVGVSTEWFAQDDEGNVWKFGEESFEEEAGALVLADDSWIAGRHGPRPWMAFAANPAVGDRYVGYRPDGLDTHLVTSLDATAVVPAGTFSPCMEVTENPDDPEDSDVILYAPGVGRASETSTTGHAALVGMAPW